MRTALVHDWLNQIGGAEDVLEALVDMFPGAPIFTSIYWPEKMPARYRGWPIRTSFMDRLPGIHQHHQPYLPLYPLAFSALDLSGYDLILSNKSGFCHGVRKPPGALHICYCLTPTRYVWSFSEYAGREGLGPTTRLLLQPLLAWLRRWDRVAARSVDQFIAISSEIQRRIAQFYERDSVIIYPPVAIERFTPHGAAVEAAARDAPAYFLSLGRLIPYKQVDLAVQACSAAHLPLQVGGDGRDRARLERLAGPSVKFLGRVPDADLPALMAGCRAFIFPGLEDFGITPVQALAAGRPVIAYAGGGALDIVQDGVNGVLFHEQTPRALQAALERFQTLHFDPQAIRRSAEKFDAAVFKEKLSAFIAEKTGIAQTGR
jgi:glycosyltransferase involved in cell wall biosynthesis